MENIFWEHFSVYIYIYIYINCKLTKTNNSNMKHCFYKANRNTTAINQKLQLTVFFCFGGSGESGGRGKWGKWGEQW